MNIQIAEFSVKFNSNYKIKKVKQVLINRLKLDITIADFELVYHRKPLEHFATIGIYCISDGDTVYLVLLQIA